MNRVRENQGSVTLMLQDALGAPWPLRLSADCTVFIGRYRRLRYFGADTGLLHYSPVHQEG